MSVQQATTPSGLSKYLPILQWLPGYLSKGLRLDVVAGLTTAAVVILGGIGGELGKRSQAAAETAAGSSCCVFTARWSRF